MIRTTIRFHWIIETGLWMILITKRLWGAETEQVCELWQRFVQFFMCQHVWSSDVACNRETLSLPRVDQESTSGEQGALHNAQLGWLITIRVRSLTTKQTTEKKKKTEFLFYFKFSGYKRRTNLLLSHNQIVGDESLTITSLLVTRV